MKKTATTRVTAKSGDRPGATDWKRLDAMSDSDVRKAALADPDAAPLTKAQLSRMRRISRVKALRERMGLTQVAHNSARTQQRSGLAHAQLGLSRAGNEVDQASFER